MSEVRYGQAINRAIADAMTADPNVVLFGEDVAAPGGPFGVTRGLRDKFGEDRVRDAPISEAALVGAGVGAAMSGLRPIVEIMFMDFITLGMDALVNQAAKARFMFGGQCALPLVVRLPHGGGINAGPQHSQCLEAWLAHIPASGRLPGHHPRCLRPDAGGHPRPPNPVIVVENKSLYAMKGDLPTRRRWCPSARPPPCARVVTSPS